MKPNCNPIFPPRPPMAHPGCHTYGHPGGHYPCPCPPSPPPPPPITGGMIPHHHFHHDVVSYEDDIVLENSCKRFETNKLLKLLISRTATGNLRWKRKMEYDSWETEAEGYLFFRLRRNVLYVVNDLEGTEEAITIRHSDHDLLGVLFTLIREGIDEAKLRNRRDVIQIVEELSSDDIDYSFGDIFGTLRTDWTDTKVQLHLEDPEIEEGDDYKPYKPIFNWKGNDEEDETIKDIHLELEDVDKEESKPCQCHPQNGPLKTGEIFYIDEAKYPEFDNTTSSKLQPVDYGLNKRVNIDLD